MTAEHPSRFRGRAPLILLLALLFWGCNRSSSPAVGGATGAAGTGPPEPRSLFEIEEARAFEHRTIQYPDLPKCAAACGKRRCLPGFIAGFYCRISCNRDGDCPHDLVCVCGTGECSGGIGDLSTVSDHVGPTFVCALQSALSPPSRRGPALRRP
jgi:hypothetical protein